jgi:RNA polymerase sigma-70 factor (family 1)
MKSLDHTDNSLLARIQLLLAARDEQALELLYRNYYERLNFFAQTFVPSPELTEEMVEDLFIKLWSNPSMAANITNLSVYLYKAIKNACLDELAKNKRAFAVDFSASAYLLEAGGSSPLEDLVLSEMNQALQVAIDSLPPRCRQIFILIREEGLPYKEVAEILNISINTIDNQMAIAIKRICAALEIRKPVSRNRINPS